MQIFQPMLLLKRAAPFDDPDWIFELKFSAPLGAKREKCGANADCPLLELIRFDINISSADNLVEVVDANVTSRPPRIFDGARRFNPASRIFGSGLL